MVTVWIHAAAHLCALWQHQRRHTAHRQGRRRQLQGQGELKNDDTKK